MRLEKQFRDFAVRGPSSFGTFCLLAGLLPLSWGYSGLMRLRRRAYERGLLTSFRLPVPVVAVGNLAAGGTGKTPVTEWLLDRFLARGLKVAVVSRGYGGRRDVEPLIVSSGSGPQVSPEQAGDEPWMLARRHPQAIVVVGRHRHQAGMTAVRECGAELVLLDDGFQHLKLKRDIDIVLLDAAHPFANGYVLPAGYLRESPQALRCADMVFQTRADSRSSKLDLEEVPCLRLGYRLARLAVGLDGNTIDLEQLKNRRAVAFCGIADPDSFFDALKEVGVDLVATRTFADHHSYPPGSVEELNRLATDADLLLTTEKDAVKLTDKGLVKPCYFLPLELDFIDGVEPLEHLLDTLLRKTRKPMNLSEDLLQILACPQCKQAVRVDAEREEIVCDACRLAYPVRDNIPVMLVDEARSF